ncbi:MAG: iron ABC transporter permease [Oscillospiraceae bacterium]|nr:iron ABC transporter permease [Oscillospiraceae bacterium]
MADLQKKAHFRETKQSRLKWATIIILPFVIFFASLFMGRYSVSPTEVVQIFANYFFGANYTQTWEDSAAKVIIQVRFPRAVMAALVGAGLSSSGAAFQGMFQNPLVSPFILGVSAGASFGAALGLVMSLPSLAVQGMAFIFGIFAVAITYFLAHIYKSTPVLMLVLSGTVVSAFFQALLQILKFTAEGDEKLPAITFWLMGSLGSVGLNDLVISIIPVIICLIGLWILSWRINVLSMGDREARSLGVHTERIKVGIIIFSTVLTSTAVSICGIIGWVGQVIPHFCRMLVGPDHKKLIPATMFVGASYILIVDNLCRQLTATEIPLGILTAIIGAPVFAFLLRKTKGGWN